MREALLRVEIDAPAVLTDSRGAPVLPAGVSGSISHKTKLAVALVARESRARLGVDIEDDVVGSLDISRRVLRRTKLRSLRRSAPKLALGRFFSAFRPRKPSTRRSTPSSGGTWASTR